LFFIRRLDSSDEHRAYLMLRVSTWCVWGKR